MEQVELPLYLLDCFFRLEQKTQVLLTRVWQWKREVKPMTGLCASCGNSLTLSTFLLCLKNDSDHYWHSLCPKEKMEQAYHIHNSGTASSRYGRDQSRFALTSNTMPKYWSLYRHKFTLFPLIQNFDKFKENKNKFKA